MSPWALLVGASAVVVIGVLGTVLVWGLVTSEHRISSLSVRGFLNGVSIDTGAGDVEILGGGDRVGVGVRRSDHFAFGHDATVERSVRGGVLRIRSRCPSTILHSCSASFRLVVPDNVPVTVRTGSGDVRFDGYRGSARIETGAGDIDLGAFCGFSLLARAASGNVTAGTSCPVESMLLRSRSGSVDAIVPPGRYRVEADSDSGHATIKGINPEQDAPFQVQALSGAGDVLVEARR